MSMHGGLPQFPGVLGPHLARGVRPWLPQLLPSVEGLLGCRVSIHDAVSVSNMASRKKSDGGAARAAGRKRVQNKRQEAKYGLQGFTAQANRNLRQPKIDRPQEIALAGIEASAFGAASAARTAVRAASSAPLRGVARSIGRAVSNARRVDVGLHVSPRSGLTRIVPSGTRTGTGMGPTPKHPTLDNVTYKTGGAFGRFWPRTRSVNDVVRQSVGLGDTHFSRQGYEAYVTRSRWGKRDPETFSGNARIVPNQQVVSSVRFPSVSQAPSQFGEWGRVRRKSPEMQQLSGQLKQARNQLDRESLEIAARSTAVVAGAVSRSTRKGGTRTRGSKATRNKKK